MIEKVKWSGRERDALMFLAALEVNLAGPDSGVLEKRIRSAGRYAWRDWKLAARLVSKVLNQLLDTLPTNNYAQLDEMLRRAKLRFEFPGPVRSPFYCIIRQEDMQVIGWHAMKNTCRDCLKTPGEAKKCELFQALIWAAPLPDAPEGDLALCPYSQCVFDREG